MRSADNLRCKTADGGAHRRDAYGSDTYGFGAHKYTTVVSERPRQHLGHLKILELKIFKRKLKKNLKWVLLI